MSDNLSDDSSPNKQPSAELSSDLRIRGCFLDSGSSSGSRLHGRASVRSSLGFSSSSSPPSLRSDSPESLLTSVSSRASSPLRRSCDGPGDINDQPIQHEKHFILVVGGLGYIGSHTTLELVKAGYNVVIIDNQSNSSQDVLDRIEILVAKYFRGQNGAVPQLRCYEADYRDLPTMKSILSKFHTVLSTQEGHREATTNYPSRITGVIHFAAYKAITESIRQPLKYYSNNVCGLVKFCSLLQELGIKNLVFSSSATVYGELANSGHPLREEYVSHETSTFTDDDGEERTILSGCTGLKNPYGRTKWMCEAILSDLATADPEWTILALRYFNPAGCDASGLIGEDPRQASNLMPAVLKVVRGDKQALDVFGIDYDTQDGTAVRDFIHVTDLAKGHIAALKFASKGNGFSGFRTFNLGSGSGGSVLAVVSAMEDVCGTAIPVNLTHRREGDVGVCVARVERAEKELGWKAEKTLKDCCTDVNNFLKLHR